MGEIEARDKMIATIKERLEDWLTYQSGEVAFLFYYQSNWATLLGSPAGHCWENGFATFPQGNDQESTSESMQFNSSLIHWGTITSNFDEAYTNGSVLLSVSTIGTGITKVEFYNGSTLLGEDVTPPYEMKASKLPFGQHGMYAKVYTGENFDVTNPIFITVGEKVPY